MKILIIDDCVDFRALLRVYLQKEMKNAEIIEYQFDLLGRPPDNFDWSHYDILFLDYKLGEHEDGLEWLRIFRKKSGFPPTIILTAEGDEYVAVKAAKLGAAEYVNKKDVSPKLLAKLINDALEFSEVGEEKHPVSYHIVAETGKSIRQKLNISTLADIRKLAGHPS